jgi:hypothetical protein
MSHSNMADGNPSRRPVDSSATPRGVIVMNVIGECAVLAIGLALYTGQQRAQGLFFLVWGLIVGPLVLFVGARNRRRLFEPARRTDRATGITLSRPPFPNAMTTPGPRRRWVGAVDVPGPRGRLGTTAPLGALELIGPSLILRIRPSALARFSFVEPLVLSPSEVETVFPARARIFGWPAIGLRPLHGPPSYFLTLPRGPRWLLAVNMPLWKLVDRRYVPVYGTERPSILAAIEAAGFPVHWEERRYSKS